jgi:hypothetical protein
MLSIGSFHLLSFIMGICYQFFLRYFIRIVSPRLLIVLIIPVYVLSALILALTLNLIASLIELKKINTQEYGSLMFNASPFIFWQLFWAALFIFWMLKKLLLSSISALYRLAQFDYSSMFLLILLFVRHTQISTVYFIVVKIPILLT